MQARLLQGWVTIATPGGGHVTIQDEEDWLDLSDFCDVSVRRTKPWRVARSGRRGGVVTREARQV